MNENKIGIESYVWNTTINDKTIIGYIYNKAANIDYWLVEYTNSLGLDTKGRWKKTSCVLVELPKWYDYLSFEKWEHAIRFHFKNISPASNSAEPRKAAYISKAYGILYKVWKEENAIFNKLLAENTYPINVKINDEKPIEENKMKFEIENKSFINNTDINDLSANTLLEYITRGQTRIEFLKSITGPKSDYVTAEIKKINAFITKVKVILDTKHMDK